MPKSRDSVNVIGRLAEKSAIDDALAGLAAGRGDSVLVV